MRSGLCTAVLVLAAEGVCGGLTPLPPEIRLLPESAHPPTTALWLFDEPLDAPQRSLLEDWSHHGYHLTLGPGAANPEHQFKLAYFPFDFWQDNRGMNVAFSPDGIHWMPYEGNPVLRHWDIMKGYPDAPTSVADINDIYWGKDLGLYVQTYKTYALPYENPMAADQRTPRWREVNDVVSGYRRIAGLATSRDFIHWENLQRVMVPDEKDVAELQFYAMSICRRGDLYIGHVRCLDDQAEEDGIGWMELATSRDLYHRTRHRDVFFKRNPAPDTRRAHGARGWQSSARTVTYPDAPPVTRLAC